MYNHLIYFFIGLFATYLFLIFYIKYFNNFVLDIPNNRSSHLIPIASSGGISFVVITCSISLFTKDQTYLYCLPLALLGLIDDKFNVPSVFRFGLQFLTVLFLFNTSEISNYEINFGLLNYLIYLILIVIGIGLINFINFMDGMDGLVTGSLIPVYFTAALTTNLNLYPLIGCLVAFLFFNWNPAKIFMGDVGSTFLGAIFAGVVFNANKTLEIVEVILLGSPLLLDALTCVLRRFFNGQNIFKAHRQHLYQRLHQGGWSHRKVSFVYILSTSVICISKLLFGFKAAFCSMFIIIFIGFYLDKHEARSFKYSIVNKK